MPFILIIVGAFILITALRGNAGAFASQIKKDFTGQKSFVYWFLAILVIGAIGYIQPLRKISDAFLILVILVLFIANKGFFAQFQTSLKQITAGNYSSGT